MVSLLRIYRSCLLALPLICGVAVADDWATRLGYPEGAKVIILHAHDMGLCHETNQAATQLLEATPSASVSAMPPCPWFGDAAAFAASNPQADVGLQVTLNSEWPRYRWRPMSRGDMAGSLVDGDGYLWRSVLQVMVNATTEDVEREMRWQLLNAERLGMKPTHLASHLGALYSRPDLTRAYLKFAQEQWIPAVVVDLTPEMAERFARQGFPIPDGLARTLDEYPLPKLEDLRIVPRTESLEEKVLGTLELLEALPEGLSQVAFSPAVDSPALRAITPKWEQFAWDHQVWQDQRVRDALAQPNVILTNWVEVMERFDPATR